MTTVANGVRHHPMTQPVRYWSNNFGKSVSVMGLYSTMSVNDKSVNEKYETPEIIDTGIHEIDQRVARNNL